MTSLCGEPDRPKAVVVSWEGDSRKMFGSEGATGEGHHSAFGLSVDGEEDLVLSVGFDCSTRVSPSFGFERRC